MERESALVGADVEGFATGVTGSSGVVEALVEEGPGLLAGGGVEVEAEAVEGEDGCEWCEARFPRFPQDAEEKSGSA